MSSFTKVRLIILATSIFWIVTLSEAKVQFTKGSVYEKIWPSKEDAVLLEAETNSMKNCSLLCVEHNAQGCSGFYFNSSSSTCTLFQGVIRGVDTESTVSTNPIYRNVMQCPLVMGYEVVHDGNARYCLGAFWRNPLSNPSAVAKCKEDGGGLINLGGRFVTMFNFWKKVTADIHPHNWIFNSAAACMAINIRSTERKMFSNSCSRKSIYTCEIVL